MGKTGITRRPLGPPTRLADGTSRPTFAGLRDDDALSICGVKNGDVWLAINGVQLDSPELALANYRGIMDAPLWTLDLIRDGQELRVVVAIR